MFSFLNEKYSFRLVGSPEDVYDEPGRLMILAGLVLLNMVSFNLAQPYLLPSQHQAIVLGEAISSQDQPDTVQLIEIYQSSLYALTQSYLHIRSASLAAGLDEGQLTFAAQADWLAAAKSYQSGLLSLTVPAGYQDLHLLAAATISREAERLMAGPLGQPEILNLSNYWLILLNDYSWLN